MVFTSLRRSDIKGEREARRVLEVACVPSLKNKFFYDISVFVMMLEMLNMTFKSCLSPIIENNHVDNIIMVIYNDIVIWQSRKPALDEAILQDLASCLQLVAHLGQDQSLVLPPLLPAVAKTHLK